MRSVEDWIRELDLLPHPEGGLYVESYRSTGSIPGPALPPGFEGDRAHCTGIFFLLRAGEHSRLHRLRSDEMWHHYDGSPLVLHILRPDGSYGRLLLGKDFEAGQSPQAVVEAGCWFGATVDAEEGYALVGCTVAPGFDFRDLELGDRERLIRRFPRHRALVECLSA